MRRDAPHFLVLSERNLKALLAKLNGHPEGSSCTLTAADENGRFWVMAEKDEVHYANRTGPGQMHPETEKEISN